LLDGSFYTLNSAPADSWNAKEKTVNKVMQVMFWASLFMSGVPQVRASEFTVYASPLGEYMIKVGPSLDESTGLMMEIAAAAFRQAGLQVKVAPSMPWARAQVEAMHQPGAILVLLAKTPAREDQWRWLSMMYTDKIYGITIREKAVFSSFDEIKTKKPRVAVKIGTASESILKSMGVAVDSTPDEHRNLLKLFYDRVDVVLLQGMVLYLSSPGRLITRLLNNSGLFFCHSLRA